MHWGIIGTALGTASVEFFETAAIAYAIGRSGFWRESITGTLVGLIGVGGLSWALGSQLQAIPLAWIQLGVGLALLWFGFGWTKKSFLRHLRQQRAGWVSEDPLAAEGLEIELGSPGFNWGNFLVMTKSSALETFEVALVVLTLSLATGSWVEPLSGAGVALILILMVISILHGQLQRIPDVWIKMGAGVMLLSYGSFFLGEGFGVEWPLNDLMILMFMVGISSLLFGIRGIWRIRNQPSHQEAQISE
ncbi:MAG: hypothetical protein HC924_10845 [Synechococcaceae cyanobacterium SM2_3_2]|nr:hypothetical protein [Synechococcaceae cyanobacterium SM2_3_2]